MAGRREKGGDFHAGEGVKGTRGGARRERRGGRLRGAGGEPAAPPGAPRGRGQPLPWGGGRGRRAGVGGGEGGGSRASAGAGGSAAPRPRPAPPRRHFAGGCRGDRRRRRALRCGGAAAGREPSELQPGESRAVSPPARPANRTCRARPRGARRAHEAGLARPPSAVTSPAARPAPLQPRPVLWVPAPADQPGRGAQGCPATPSPRRPSGPGPWALTLPAAGAAARSGPQAAPRGGKWVPGDPAGRRRRLLPGPRHARPGVALPSSVPGRCGWPPRAPGIQGHQEGGGGVPCTFFAFFSSTKAEPSNFRSCCPDPRAFLSGLFPGGRGFPLLATLLEGEMDLFECDYLKG